MSGQILVEDIRSPSVRRRNTFKFNHDQVFSLSYALMATLALILLLPLMLGIALAIFLQDGGPVVFSHRRIGQHWRSFRCLKFRTMARDAESRLAALLANDPRAREEWDRDHKLRHDPRITPLGALLRKSSLDELPQLINVIRGEMSLVGPRPIVEAEIPRYGARMRYYCAVKPGITGIWQVSGRNNVSYRRRVAMDCIYARKRSARLDAWLIIMTIPAVLIRRGSY